MSSIVTIPAGSHVCTHNRYTVVLPLGLTPPPRYDVLVTVRHRYEYEYDPCKAHPKIPRPSTRLVCSLSSRQLVLVHRLRTKVPSKSFHANRDHFLDPDAMAEEDIETGSCRSIFISLIQTFPWEMYLDATSL